MCSHADGDDSAERERGGAGVPSSGGEGRSPSHAAASPPVMGRGHRAGPQRRGRPEGAVGVCGSLFLTTWIFLMKQGCREGGCGEVLKIQREERRYKIIIWVSGRENRLDTYNMFVGLHSGPT